MPAVIKVRMLRNQVDGGTNFYGSLDGSARNFTVEEVNAAPHKFQIVESLLSEQLQAEAVEESRRHLVTRSAARSRERAAAVKYARDQATPDHAAHALKAYKLLGLNLEESRTAAQIEMDIWTRLCGGSVEAAKLAIAMGKK